MTPSEAANLLLAKYPDLLGPETQFRGESTIEVLDAENIATICQYAKDQLGFDLLTDLSSLDDYGQDPRWTVVYELYGVDINCHLRLKTKVAEQKSALPSVTHIWPTANWHEREAFDMMGIQFTGHPDLRRILMWEGYPYHPLRKDFPLAGKPIETLNIAFSRPAPLEGGPFVTVAGGKDAISREPRSRTADH